MWYQIQDDGEYRDYENSSFGEKFARITFVWETHTAYGMLSNPEATADNYVETFLDIQEDLTWEQAEEIIGSIVDPVIPAPN